MNTQIRQTDILTQECDLLVLPHFQGVARLAGVAALVDKGLEGGLSKLVGEDKFEGRLGQTLVFPTFGKLKARKVALLGLGDKKHFGADAARRIGGHIAKLAQQAHAENVATVLAASNVDARTAGQMLAEGLVLSAYRFHRYHGTQKKKDTRPVHELKQFTLCETDGRAIKLAREGWERGVVLAEATNLARDLVNTPSAHMLPRDLAAAAQALSGKGVGFKVMSRSEMEKMGMEAALSVARGSAHEPIGVHLVYKPKGAKKRIAIVGK
ncbi:MAG: M17 family peptidase N-terminal domain-containing protein, partial [Alphaproteobacteria bacterium]|nr:M17 family peptidase N-terminal domain-containing protein [Alphaproteobacteria bacterium]